MKSINQNAPVKCIKTININASQEKVWAVLTDINKWRNWQLDIKYSKLNGPLAPNITFDWKSGGLNIHSTLHTVDRPEHFGWTGRALGTYAIHNWTLSQLESSILITVEESMQGLLVSLFKKFFRNTLETGLQRWLDWLKKECEK